MWQALFLFGLNYVSCMELPGYIQACSRNDPNLNDCALKSAKESIYRFSQGDSSRGLHPLDPIHVAVMTVFVPNENGLKVVFKKNDFNGLSAMELKSLKFNLEKKVITVDAVINLDVKNIYELSGRILVVPIKSNGDASIKLRNTTIHVKLWYDDVEGNDRKIHWRIRKHDIKYEVERAYFRLENLLGDKNIGDQINKLLNELWRDIIADLGPSICDSLLNAVVDSLTVFLDQVSFDEMMPEQL